MSDLKDVRAVIMIDRTSPRPFTNVVDALGGKALDLSVDPDRALDSVDPAAVLPLALAVLGDV